MKRGRPTNHYLHYSYIIWRENDGSFSCYDINNKNRIKENDNLFKDEKTKDPIKGHIEVTKATMIQSSFSTASNENPNNDLFLNHYYQAPKQKTDVNYALFDLKPDYIDIMFDQQLDFDSFEENNNICFINDEKNSSTSFIE